VPRAVRLSVVSAINYDEKDPFLCNACGYCKYAKFDFTVTSRPCCAVDPIENDDDRKKVCDWSLTVACSTYMSQSVGRIGEDVLSKLLLCSQMAFWHSRASLVQESGIQMSPVLCM